MPPSTPPLPEPVPARYREYAIRQIIRGSEELLQPVALWLHRENDRRYAPLTEVLRVLKKPLQQLGRGNVTARQLLEDIRDRSGVFVGYTEEDYGFIHLTFQQRKSTARDWSSCL